jgi:hypothetical protein
MPIDEGGSMSMVTRTASVLAAVIALAAVAAAVASAARSFPNPIVMRATAIPTFLGPTSSCPAGRAHEQVTNLDGRVIGAFEFCFATFAGDPIAGDVATGVATFYLACGTIETTLTLAETPIADGVVQTDNGSVTRATGTYAGASGPLTGGGAIVFDANGVPHPDLTLTIALS